MGKSTKTCLDRVRRAAFVDGAPLRESATVRRFQGWSQGGHWMLDTDSPAPGPGQIPNGGA